VTSLVPIKNKHISEWSNGMDSIEAKEVTCTRVMLANRIQYNVTHSTVRYLKMSSRPYISQQSSIAKNHPMGFRDLLS